MLIPKKNRKEVYKYLFREGVIYAKKDFNLPAHPEIKEVPNLQVIKLMQSFTSKELVKEIFSWRYYYWYLTNEGIEFLREYLNLSADVVPNTLKKSTRPPTRPMADERPPRGDRPGGGRGGGDRGGYRSERPGGYGRGGGDKGGAPGAYNPQFA
jgi:small subunit ribosomal protein S10e